MKEYWTIKLVSPRLTDPRGTHIDYRIGSLNKPVEHKDGWLLFQSRIAAKAVLWQLRLESSRVSVGYIQQHRLVHHTKKPRGAKVGTWAWACEQMLAGKMVRLPCWRVGVVQKISARGLMVANGLSPTTFLECQTTAEDLKATDWQVYQ